MAIEPKDFGKDHWSLLGYIQYVCMNASPRNGGVGEMDRRKLRCNPSNHPMLSSEMTTSWKPEYGSRLQGYWTDGDKTDSSRLVLDHDDWDCIDDMEAAGYVELISMVNGFIRLTPLGAQIAGKLAEYKSLGGNYADFTI